MTIKLLCKFNMVMTVPRMDLKVAGIIEV